MREKDPMVMLRGSRGDGGGSGSSPARRPAPGPCRPDELADAALELGVDPGRVEVLDTVEEALARALAVTPPQGQVIVAGSLYLVGAARAVLPTIRYPRP